MSKELSVNVSASALTALVHDVLVGMEMTSDHADTVAAALVWADLRGVASHGVARLPRYVEMIEAGDMNARPVLRLVSDTPVMAIVDADRAAGPVAMMFGKNAAVERAKRSGVGVALVRATTHTAALGHYTEAACAAGVVALAMAASGPTMAYHGARAAGVSTSPISIAAPGGAAGPVVFDMGSGMASLGKLAQARLAGLPLPEGWALDGRGEPTTDPAMATTPLPLGGPKGSGLSLMIEIVVSLLASNPILAATLAGGEGSRRHRQNGLFIALDIAHFCDAGAFIAEMDNLRTAIRALPPVVAGEPILLPGERGTIASRQRLGSGVDLPARTASDLRALADRYAVASPESFAVGSARDE